MSRYYGPPVRYWRARAVDTGTCPACDLPIEKNQLVTFYRRLNDWRPGEVRHHKRDCVNETVSEVSGDETTLTLSSR